MKKQESPDTDEHNDEHNDEEFIRQYLKTNDCSNIGNIRVLYKDSIYTSDLKPDRINLVVANGKIIRIWMG